ncbi:MAG: TetR/AcrR family transcriptional regulator [Actinomycetota bacterium]|nr:TetR/AcrR family transcriptional regulator [Actinomycetota bacterium]
MTTTVPDVTGDAVDGDPRIARSRSKLLAAATDLLMESGPRAVTVDAVAERSGVAKSTLYRHWPSRNDLLVDVMRSHVPETPMVDLSLGFEAALRSQISIAVGVFSDPEWLRILPSLVSLQHHVPQMAELMAADREAKLAMLRDVIDLGVAEGRLPAGLDPLQVLHLLIGPLMFAVLSGDGDGLPGLADEVVARFLASYS